MLSSITLLAAWTARPALRHPACAVCVRMSADEVVKPSIRLDPDLVSAAKEAAFDQAFL